MGRLDGKVAIVTGGASGMGLATVKKFVAEGARVVIGDVQGDPGAQLARELGDAVRFQLTDVSREADVEALVTRAVEEFGQLDCIFNNAGFGGIGGEMVDLDFGDAYRHTIDVLFTGVAAGTKHAARVMKGARRQHHQYRLGCRAARRLRSARVQRDEGRGAVAVAHGRARTRRTRHSRECDLPGLHRHRDLRRRAQLELRNAPAFHRRTREVPGHR